MLFLGKYDKFYDQGVYQCVVCHQDLFSSDTKYDSGCGWPAFNDGKQNSNVIKDWKIVIFQFSVLEKGKVTLHKDASIAGIFRNFRLKLIRNVVYAGLSLLIRLNLSYAMFFYRKH